MDQSTVKVLVAAVVGAGVVIGTAGLFLYNEIYGEKRRVAMQQTELRNLHTSVAELKAELVALQAKQRVASSSRQRRQARSETDSEYGSAIATDDEDDEFYDISDEDLSGSGEPDDPVLSRLLSTTDSLLSGSSEDKREAYRELCDHMDMYEASNAVQWRLAKACSNMATLYQAEGDKERRQQAIEQGLTAATRALTLDTHSAAAHKWFAILIGSRSEFGGIKEKIEDGHLFKQHIDEALTLTPDDYSLHHLLARFKYEVAALSWLERKMAATLFAEPPTASMEDAITDCLNAERLNSESWMQNKLLLAKCYIAQSEYSQAVRWLKQAVELPRKTADDEVAHEEAETLLEKYRGFVT